MVQHARPGKFHDEPGGRVGVPTQDRVDVAAKQALELVPIVLAQPGVTVRSREVGYLLLRDADSDIRDDIAQGRQRLLPARCAVSPTVPCVDGIPYLAEPSGPPLGDAFAEQSLTRACRW